MRSWALLGAVAGALVLLYRRGRDRVARTSPSSATTPPRSRSRRRSSSVDLVAEARPARVPARRRDGHPQRARALPGGDLRQADGPPARDAHRPGLSRPVTRARRRPTRTRASSTSRSPAPDRDVFVRPASMNRGRRSVALYATTSASSGRSPPRSTASRSRPTRGWPSTRPSRPRSPTACRPSSRGWGSSGPPFIGGGCCGRWAALFVLGVPRPCWPPTRARWAKTRPTTGG